MTEAELLQKAAEAWEGGWVFENCQLITSNDPAAITIVGGVVRVENFSGKADTLQSMVRHALDNDRS